MKIAYKLTAAACLLGALAALYPEESLACTAACTPDIKATGPIITKSFDWDNRDGLVVLNDTKIKKTAVGVDHPYEWKVDYANVTFNQWGINMPMGGMNVEGLVVELTKVGDFLKKKKANDYGTKSGDTAMNQLQWVQYILDTSGTLKAARENARKVYVVPTFKFEKTSFREATQFEIDPVHYLVCDKTAKCLIFEYRDKKLLISEVHSWTGTTTKMFTNGALPFGSDNVLPSGPVEVPLVPVLANNYIHTDVSCLASYAALPSGVECAADAACKAACKSVSDKVKDSNRSTRRYLMAAASAASPSGINNTSDAVNYGFGTMLKGVCNKYTRWQVVYLPKLQKVYWRTVKGNQDPDKCKAAHKGYGSVDLKKETGVCTPATGINAYDLDGSVGPDKKAYAKLKKGAISTLNTEALYLNFRHSRFKTTKLKKEKLKKHEYSKAQIEKDKKDGEKVDHDRAWGLNKVQQDNWACHL